MLRGPQAPYAELDPNPTPSPEPEPEPDPDPKPGPEPCPDLHSSDDYFISAHSTLLLALHFPSTVR